MNPLQKLAPTTQLGRQLRLMRLRLKPLRRHDIVHREALRRPALRFVQVGANDGVIADPLHPFIEQFNWTGVMVEPQPSVFREKLEPLYSDNPSIALVNAAIGPAPGTLPLYQLSFSNERWATGKASLNRSVLENIIESVGSIN